MLLSLLFLICFIVLFGNFVVGLHCLCHDSKLCCHIGLTYKSLLSLARGNLFLKRQPLIPRILSVSEAAEIARKPFKPPCGKGYRDHNEELARRLSARKRFVPWGSGQPLTPISNLLPQAPVSSTGDDILEKREELPPGVEPLILWRSEESDKENDNNWTMIEVDPLLVRFLRPHQRYFH